MSQIIESKEGYSTNLKQQNGAGCWQAVVTRASGLPASSSVSETGSVTVNVEVRSIDALIQQDREWRESRHQ